MRAMILAAGRGERMGALTNQLPKPLLKVNGRYLIEYILLQLIHAGIRDIVINVSYHREQIKQALGNGSAYGINIVYSEEEGRLETGGGIFQALPLLGNAPFLAVSSDIITNYPFKQLLTRPLRLAHLVLVANPVFHADGDFCLQENEISRQEKCDFTFANIGIYHPELFASCSPGRFPLRDILFPAIEAKQVTGEQYTGAWYNIGTPLQLIEAETHLRAREESNL